MKKKNYEAISKTGTIKEAIAVIVPSNSAVVVRQPQSTRVKEPTLLCNHYPGARRLIGKASGNA
jgi:hypothetical protein